MPPKPEENKDPKLAAKPEPKKDEAPSPVDKVKSDVEPKTDPLAAVEALVAGLADQFKAAALIGQEEAHEMAEEFAGRAAELAKAVLAGVEEKWSELQKERGYGLGIGAGAPQKQSGQFAPDQPEPADPPHNLEAVRAAVKLGMSEEDARAMTHMGANT